MCQLAGELAKRFDLLPLELDPKQLVEKVYKAWVTDAGATATNDNKTAAKRLTQFIDERSGLSIIRVDGKNELHEPRGRRDGWIDEKSGYVFLLRNALAEALGAYSVRSFCRAMVEQEHAILKPEAPGQMTRKTTAYKPSGDFDITRTTMPRTYQFRLDALRAYADDVDDHTPYQRKESQQCLKDTRDSSRTARSF